MMEFLHGSIVKEEADTYRIPAVLPVTESDLIEYCGKRMEESKLAQLLQVLARGTEPKAKTGRDIRLNKVLPIMIEELVMRGTREQKLFEIPFFCGEVSEVNGLSVQAHGLLARIFAIASKKTIDTAMKKSVKTRMAGAGAQIKRREYLYALMDNVGFKMAGGKWQQLTLLIICAITEAELEAVG
jgi:hypothetical protein